MHEDSTGHFACISCGHTINKLYNNAGLLRTTEFDSHDLVKMTSDEHDELTDQSINNGGATSYYDLDPEWTTAMDIVEARELNYSQGNILKVAITLNTDRHSGTTYERELNKLIYFANRELARISNEHI